MRFLLRAALQSEGMKPELVEKNEADLRSDTRKEDPTRTIDRFGPRRDHHNRLPSHSDLGSGDDGRGLNVKTAMYWNERRTRTGGRPRTGEEREKKDSQGVWRRFPSGRDAPPVSLHAWIKPRAPRFQLLPSASRPSHQRDPVRNERKRRNAGQ